MFNVKKLNPDTLKIICTILIGFIWNSVIGRTDIWWNKSGSDWVPNAGIQKKEKDTFHPEGVHSLAEKSKKLTKGDNKMRYKQSAMGA